MMTRSDQISSQFNALAMVLAWVLPGLGHISLGDRRRGLLIMAGTLFLFFGGMLIGGLDVVDRRNDRLWFLAQAGCGPVAFVADFANARLLQSGRIGTLYRAGSSRSAKPPVSSFSGLSHVNEYGTLFGALAGMMNVIVIMDAATRAPRPFRVDRRAGS
jgi:hypothetical protein